MSFVNTFLCSKHIFFTYEGWVLVGPGCDSRFGLGCGVGFAFGPGCDPLYGLGYNPGSGLGHGPSCRLEGTATFRVTL